MWGSVICSHPEHLGGGLPYSPVASGPELGVGVKSDKKQLEELTLEKCGEKSVDSNAFLHLFHRLWQIANCGRTLPALHLPGTEGSVWFYFK